MNLDRLRVFSLPHYLFANCAEYGRSFQIDGLPEGAVVLGAEYHLASRTFDLIVQHDSFAAVPPGEFAPRGGRAQLAYLLPEIDRFVGRKFAWSVETFGGGERTEGLLKHLHKELEEVRQNPHDLVEWIDIILLAMDGYCRHGGDPRGFFEALTAKQRINTKRSWQQPKDGEPVEHVRAGVEA